MAAVERQVRDELAALLGRKPDELELVREDLRTYVNVPIEDLVLLAGGVRLRNESDALVRRVEVLEVALERTLATLERMVRRVGFAGLVVDTVLEDGQRALAGATR